MAAKNKKIYNVLDNCLNAMIADGIITVGKLKKGWNSIKGLVSVKRMQFFLRKNGFKLHWKCMYFFKEVQKSFVTRIQKEFVTNPPKNVSFT